jgi:hypothetical protein
VATTSPVRRRIATGLVGRDRELAALQPGVSTGSAPAVIHLHGIPGIGKSHLLAAFVDALGDSATVHRLDGRTIEPTERGFTDALAEAAGVASSDDVGELTDRLAADAVLVLDNYETFRLMDTWLRQELVPRLREGQRLIIAGREPPVAAWLTAPELAGTVQAIPLGPLETDASLAMLAGLGLEGDRAVALAGVARGHPLALRLGSAALAGRPDLPINEVAGERLLEQLAEIFLADVPDPLTRKALEAASVVRRSTRSLLGAMLPEADADELLTLLRALPFVETRSDGLVVHQAVQGAVDRSLRASDPVGYRDLRRAAWQQLRSEVRQAPPSQLWRYTADMLYLIENPVLREAFFPSGAHPLAVERALPSDREAVSTIAHRHETPEAASLLVEWFDRVPESTSVVRDRDGLVIGFLCLIDRAQIMDPAVDDPVVHAWRGHLTGVAVPERDEVLGLRRWLDMDVGELPCPSQAACWLDVKRTYMLLRPDLRGIYTVVVDVPTYWPVVQPLGFVPIGSEPATIGDRAYTSVWLDFGPESVDGWLTRLAAGELEVHEALALDADSHELVVDGIRVQLTPLEFGVVRSLREAGGAGVSRDRLLDQVWGYDFDGGSNVVDVLVSGLRQKLGVRRDLLETVRGVGYRLREP